MPSSLRPFAATTSASSLNGHRDTAPPRIAPPKHRSRRRLLVGGMVMAVCVLGFVLAAVAAGPRGTAVLVMARSVPAGHVITSADLTTTQLSGAGGVADIPAAEQATVVGQPAVVPLTAGALLAPSQVGSGRFPSAGQAVVALALKEGQFPPVLAVGARVAVMLGSGTAPVIAAVSDVEPSASTQGTTIVSLLVADGAVGTVTGSASPVLALLTSGGSDVP